MSVELKFILRYTGGKADESILDLYDASTSMQGLAKALAITSYALINDGKVRRKGDNIPNVDFYLQPSKKGSFIEIVTIIFQQPAVQVLGSSVLVAAFWDFISFTWNEATGREASLKEFKTKKLLEQNETLSEEISHALEIPLQQLHKPIQKDRNIEIEIRRPRSNDPVLKFNQNTLDYVMSEGEPEEVDNIIGNVTKYNILTGIGRFYDDRLGKTVSFHSSSELDENGKNTLSWSLHHSNQTRTGKISIFADAIKSNSGHLKRYIIKNAER
ncbi:hypothetical protein [Chryseobacterium sp.]|uniref:DUF7946 domain-containing protein n=1 Tax=Chryseobacterium sp. TaxID=1871047 RepID=UPI00261C3C47|nr:hypothetical protein [Chryseobacterium sp.]